MKTAKLFKNGQSQAVRLPKEFRFKGADFVYIKKKGNCIILIPIDNPWQSLINTIGKFSEDFMQEREILRDQEREDFLK